MLHIFSFYKGISYYLKNFLKRYFTAFIAINHLWASCVWAGVPRIIEEQLTAPQARVYGSSGIGIVEPFAVEDDAVHNIFDNLQILKNGGAVFQTAPDTNVVYNRIYNAKPVALSGTIQTYEEAEMVFTNPGGFQLDNADFNNIPALTIAAGQAAKTSDGMACGIGETGDISLQKTVYGSKENGRYLILSGKGVSIADSILNPLEFLKISVGSQLLNLDTYQTTPVDLSKASRSSTGKPSSLEVDASTVLRSNSIKLENLDEGGNISIKSLIQTTAGGLLIDAIGDIYLDKIIAMGDLTIRTTGKVVLGDQVMVGGNVKIKAQDIELQKGLSSLGRIHMRAVNNLNLKGYLTTPDTAKLTSKKGKTTNHAEINAEGGIILKGLKTENYKTIQTSNFLETTGILVNQAKAYLGAKSFLNPENVLAHNLGQIEAMDSIQATLDKITLKGNIWTAGKFILDGQDITLEGQIEAKSGGLFEVEKLTNNGTLNLQGTGLHGNVGFFYNRGDLETSGITANFKETHNYGSLRTRGHFSVQGRAFQNYEGARIFTAGVHQVGVKDYYIDAGTLYTPTLLMLNGQSIDFKRTHRSFIKDGLVSAESRLNVSQGTEIHLKSHTDKCFLQLSSAGDLTNAGNIYLTSAQYPYLDYFKTVQNGKTIQQQSTFSIQEFAREIAVYPLGAWNQTKKKLGSGVALEAGGNLTYKGDTRLENSSLRVLAGGKLESAKGNLQAGYFNGNNVHVQADKAIIDRSTLTSLFGKVIVSANGEARLSDSKLYARESATLSATNLSMNRTSVVSTAGSTQLHGENRVQMNNSTAKAKEIVSVTGGRTNINNSQLKGQQYVAVDAQRLEMNNSKVKSTQGGASIQGHKGIKASNNQFQTQTGTHMASKKDISSTGNSFSGQFNSMKGRNVSSSNDTVEGNMAYKAKQNLNVHNLTSNGDVRSKSGNETTISGQTIAKNWTAAGKKIVNNSNLTVTESARFEADILEQNKTIKAAYNLTLKAKEQYKDNATSLNQAGKTLTLDAQQNDSFNGQQIADIAIIKVRDMNLLDLLNKVNARETEAHITGDVVFDQDTVLNRTLRLWANRLENKAKFTASGDFIAHLKTTFVNQGLMDIQGKAAFYAEQGITNQGDIQAQEGLGLETKGTLTQKGKVDGGNGDLTIKARRIEANAEVQTTRERTASNAIADEYTSRSQVKSAQFSGKNVYVEADEDIQAKGAEIKAQQNVGLKAGGNIDMSAVAYIEEQKDYHIHWAGMNQTAQGGPKNRYHTANVQAGGNFTVQTAGRFDAQGIQAQAGGNIRISADKGANVDSVAAVSVTERWDYQTGIFNQNNHKGFREKAEFYQTNLISGGNTVIIAKEGGLDARGVKLNAQGQINIEVRDDVNLGALKVTEHEESRDEQFLGSAIGAVDEKKGSIERIRLMEGVSNQKIKVYSKQGKIEGEATVLAAPEVELHGEKGVHFKPVEIRSAEDHHHYENNINVNPTNVEFEHKEAHTRTRIMQQLAGTIRADKLIVSTGQNAEALFVSNISGFKEGGNTDIESDTDKLTFLGTNSTKETTTDTMRVAVSVDASGTPGGGFGMSHQFNGSTTYSATQQNIGNFHNKRKGATLVVGGGAQTNIDETSGAAMHVIEDRTAQNKQKQDGYAFDANFSSTGGGASVSAKGGEKVERDNLTRCHIGKSSNNVTRTTNTHENNVKNTMWEVGAGVQFSDKGTTVSGQLGIGDTKLNATVPTDEKGLKKYDPTNIETPKDLKSINAITEKAALYNNTANGLGLKTGEVGNIINKTNQVTSAAKQVETGINDLTSPSKSENGQTSTVSGLMNTAETVTGTARSAVRGLKAVGVNTGDVGEAINQAHSFTQTANNTRKFGEAVHKNLTKDAAIPLKANTDSRSVNPANTNVVKPAATTSKPTVATNTANSQSNDDLSPAMSSDEEKTSKSPHKPVKGQKEKAKSHRKLASLRKDSDNDQDDKLSNFQESSSGFKKAVHKGLEILESGQAILNEIEEVGQIYSDSVRAQQMLEEIGSLESYTEKKLAELESKAKEDGKEWNAEDKARARKLIKVIYKVTEIAANEDNYLIAERMALTVQKELKKAKDWFSQHTSGKIIEAASNSAEAACTAMSDDKEWCEDVGKIAALGVGALLPSPSSIVSKSVGSKTVQSTKNKGKKASTASNKKQTRETSARISPIISTTASSRPSESPHYSVIYEVQLEKGKHYPNKSDKEHFKEANKVLYEKLKTRTAYSEGMETTYPGLAKAVQPNTRNNYPGTSPSTQELTWHHNPHAEGRMELIPRSHHQDKGKVQSSLHPNRKGGMQVWGGGRKKNN